MKEELAQKILQYKTELRVMEHSLFGDNKELFFNRILRICEQTIRGHKDPTTTQGDYFMEFGMVKNGLEGLEKRKYPSSSITFEVEEHFSDSKLLTYIDVSIEASWHDEIDGNRIICFPIDDEEFEAYMQRLTESADKREEKAKKDLEERMKSIEEKEKEQLKLLKEKYETGG